ncbi:MULTISPECIES: hypothetical protein [Sphingobacterium]|uniref:Uncharacterized protein n=1 Tax=Sphingobacterium populi TaxID=1812824 RepID=A0ABW5U9Y7_9SPHI|nr:hypothetical protein [Sphingobacterium sp. CFCC 11742]
MSKFKTLEEAQEAYDKLVSDSKTKTAEAVKNAQASKDKTIENLKQSSAKLKDENDGLKKQLKEATDVANDAIAQVNTPKDNFVKAKVGSKQYKVNFGVDGKTPEEIAKDNDVLNRLVEIGSGAITEL